MAMKRIHLDPDLCTGCCACQIICRDLYQLVSPGEIYRKVIPVEQGTWPYPKVSYVHQVCRHCNTPSCMDACPKGAIQKDAETSLVYLQDSLCVGCGTCKEACPYDAIIIRTVNGRKKAGKCDGCLSLIREGETPACVSVCGMRALYLV